MWGATMSFVLKILTFLTRVVGRKRCWVITPTAELIPEPKPGKALLCIISRASYSEFCRSYPIESKSELRAVLANEYQGEVVFHQINRVSAHSHAVTSYVLRQDTVQNLPKFAVCLPESMLYGYYEKDIDTVIRINSMETPWFFGWAGTSAVSQLLTPMCSNADQFKLINGIPLHAKVIEFEESELGTKYIAALKSLPLPTWFNFTYINLGGVKLKNWRLLVGVLATFCVIYFAISTAYINIMTSERRSELQAISADAERLLMLESSLNNDVRYIESGTEILSKQRFSHPFWSLIMLSQTERVELVSARWVSGVVYLQGRTESATNFFTKISSLPSVSQTEFDSPTRRVNGIELFSLRITMKGNNVAE